MVDCHKNLVISKLIRMAICLSELIDGQEKKDPAKLSLPSNLCVIIIYVHVLYSIYHMTSCLGVK